MAWCYLMVDLDAHGAFGDFPDSAGSALVEFRLHAFVGGAVQLEVHVVTFLVGPHVVRDACVPFLPEGASEQISDPRTNTVTTRHFCSLAYGVAGENPITFPCLCEGYMGWASLAHLLMGWTISPFNLEQPILCWRLSFYFFKVDVNFE